AQAFGHAIVFTQPGQTVMAEGLNAEFGTMLEGAHGAHRMQTAYQAAEHQQMVGVVHLRCAATETAKQAEAEPGKLEQGASVYHHRRYDRNVPFDQLQGELVFLEDGLVGPASGAIELGDQRYTVLDADLKNPVLVTVEGQ